MRRLHYRRRMSYQFRSELWMHSGNTSWHFVTLPEDQADEIEEITHSTARGFGSVRVAVTIGLSTWKTSLFPDSKAGSYVLPIKKPIRLAEGLAAGEMVDVSIELVDHAELGSKESNPE